MVSIRQILNLEELLKKRINWNLVQIFKLAFYYKKILNI